MTQCCNDCPLSPLLPIQTGEKSPLCLLNKDENRLGFVVWDRPNVFWASEVFKAQCVFASAQGFVRISIFGIYSSATPHMSAWSKTSLLALKKSSEPDQTQPLTHHKLAGEKALKDLRPEASRKVHAARLWEFTTPDTTIFQTGCRRVQAWCSADLLRLCQAEAERLHSSSYVCGRRTLTLLFCVNSRKERFGGPSQNPAGCHGADDMGVIF